MRTTTNTDLPHGIATASEAAALRKRLATKDADIPMKSQALTRDDDRLSGYLSSNWNRQARFCGLEYKWSGSSQIRLSGSRSSFEQLHALITELRASATCGFMTSCTVALKALDVSLNAAQEAAARDWRRAQRRAAREAHAAFEARFPQYATKDAS